MRKLFEAADRYVETSDWKIIAEAGLYRGGVCLHRDVYSADDQVRSHLQGVP